MPTQSFCTVCGAPLGDGLRFCQSCGAPVEAPAAVPIYAAPDSPAPTPIATPATTTAGTTTPAASPARDPAGHAAPPKSKVPLIVGIVAVLAIAGAAIGYLATRPAASGSSSETGAGSTGGDGGGGDPATSVLMPGLIGQTLDDAKKALAKKDITDIKIVEKEDGTKEPGMVIETDPAERAKVAPPGPVTLTVTKLPTAMPSFVNMNLEQAKSTAAESGISVTSTNQVNYDLEQSSKKVLSQEPAAGAGFAKTVTLTVEVAPGVKYLDQLTTAQGSPDSSQTGVVNVDGKSYSHAIYNTVCYGYDSSRKWEVEYNLSKAYKRLRGVVGIDDNTASGTVRFQFFLDSTPLGDPFEVSLNHSLPVDLDVTDGLRLRIEATILASPDPKRCESTKVTVADGRLLGDPDKVNTTGTSVR